jgi:hypothetical protein
MLSFATEFPVSHSHDPKEFLAAIRRWILGSPHTQFAEADLSDIPQNAGWSTKKGSEAVHTLFVQGSSESAAVRWTTLDGDIEWDTAVVFSRQELDSWVGIRTSRESQHPAFRLPPARKPFVVKTLLEILGGAKDGELPVSDSAFRLTNNDIGLASRLITGDARCRLPVVYVSCGFAGDYILDFDRLAKALSGMAHVVVEPNRPFSCRLQIEVDSENVYGGRIGVYWPEGAGRRSFFIGGEYENPGDLARAISDEIRIALMNRRPLVRCTWSAVQELASQELLRELRATGSNAVDKYVKAFDAELQAKSDQLNDAEKEIGRLSAEIRKYEAQAAVGKGVTLRTGDEHDLYVGEMAGIVRDALQDAATRVASNSRRAHVLNSILHNSAPSVEAKEQREFIKRLLRDYRSLDAKTKSGLESLGFSIEEEGRHHKMTFHGDTRYMFTLSKTSSDYRAGLNLASDISKQLF